MTTWQEFESIASDNFAPEPEENPMPLLVSKAGIPARYAGGFDALSDNPLLAQMETWAREFKPGAQGLILSGGHGTGKSHLACAILRVVAARYSGRYANVSDLFFSLRTAMNSEITSEAEIIEALTSPDLLVLDDVGLERASEYSAAQLYLIVNRRYEELKTIIVTTNLTMPEIAARLGENGQRIVSRLCETCDVVRLPVIDWRRP